MPGRVGCATDRLDLGSTVVRQSVGVVLPLVGRCHRTAEGRDARCEMRDATCGAESRQQLCVVYMYIHVHVI